MVRVAILSVQTLVLRRCSIELIMPSFHDTLGLFLSLSWNFEGFLTYWKGEDNKPWSF